MLFRPNRIRPPGKKKLCDEGSTSSFFHWSHRHRGRRRCGAFARAAFFVPFTWTKGLLSSCATFRRIGLGLLGFKLIARRTSSRRHPILHERPSQISTPTS